MDPRPSTDRLAGPARCYRHPEAETGIRCTRCDRPICTACMVSASVGFQCPPCVRDGSGTGHSAGANQPRTLTGGRMETDGRLVTKILIGVNLAVYLAVLVLGDRFVDRLVLIGHAFNPWLGEVVGVADGEWYRLLTATVLHQEIFHILFNVMGLWVIGGIVEPELGRARFALLCLLSGLSGSTLAYLVAAPNQPSLGASGVVYGLIGAWVVLARRHRHDMRPVILFVALSLLVTFTRPGISWEAHVGGLVAGALVTYALVHAPRAHRNLVQYGACGLVLLLDVGLVLGRTMALT
ncbi:MULTISPECIES: rhomboid family intramembrane serine protease [unclassified Streptomyces]|uniref:rhomboid family intramembrane serine protease n=1 Tax=unclassified Streptomyces TaxID=2593676 RepID=UPI001661403E|nr:MULTISPECIES: rhomboid family intramembrane serine protease [unclassified Streptomyces]MBD0708336.1 rhomboid family intramembrane serine protease [Streptomyces sp. CBMA291]MBD0717392.1 rhomboid family intramembrane serine protease [Streptomyces sp. CBMA370]